ncbi:hypothetical protein LCGC14_2005150 [marine sediment metagenome]|uniref:Uncharacterized protein n=1 Tax=marine sediment metagenome TaxID=412755 RepID=A0A0F9HFE4_9ZZZZ
MPYIEKLKKLVGRIKRKDGAIKEVWTEDEVEFNNFCPFCSAPDKELTSHIYHDELIRRDVINAYCNKCKKTFLIIEIKKKIKAPKI